MTLSFAQSGSRQFRSAITLLLLVLLAGTFSAFAQVQTSTEISGVVTDPKGAVIPGAEVTLTNQSTGAMQTAKSNGTGSYAFLSILPGTYSVKAEAAGFKVAEITNRIAQVAEPAVVDFKLVVGSGQTVSVSAEGADLIDSTTAEVSGTINQKLVSTLPMDGRDFMDLVSMTPGTTSSNSLGTFASGQNQESFAQAALQGVNAAGLSLTAGVFLGGNRDTSNNVSVDGSNIQLAHEGQTVQLQSPADIESVRVESGVMNAEFGFGTGAINIVTKSGTNEFHGEVYEYLRNNDLDSTNYFTKLVGFTNPGYKMNQFGAAVGGPILKDKVHFFANYEGLRVAQSTLNQAPTPIAGPRTGNFSTFGYETSLGSTPMNAPIIYNPYQVNTTTGARTAFPGNQIPLGATTLCAPRPTCVDPAMLAYLQYSPLPNGYVQGTVANPSGSGNVSAYIPNYINTTPTQITGNQYTGRVDWDLGSKDRIFARYTHSQVASIQTGIAPIAGLQNPYGSTNPVISWTRIVTPASTNSLTISFTRGNWASKRNTDGFGDISSQLGLVNTSNSAGGPATSATPFTIASSNSSLTATLEDTIQLKDDFSFYKGKHNFKFGAQYNDRRVHYDNKQFDKGVLTFGNIYTTACELGHTATCTNPSTGAGGSALADYLLGTLQESKLVIPGAKYDADQRYIGLYAQDSYRLTKRITVNFGLRYDYWTPWLNVRRMAVRWNAATGNVVYALANPLDYLNASTNYGKNGVLTAGESAAGYRTGTKDFSPRGGIAYMLNDSTTIRAGAGIYFDGNANQNQMSSIQSGAGPFGFTYDSIVAGNEALPPLVAYQQFPTPSPTAIAAPSTTSPQTIRVLGSNYYATPTVYEWSASIQHRFGKDWVLESTYLGTHTIREMEYVDENIPAQPLGALAAVSMQLRRPFTNWGAVQTWIPLGYAHYGAITTSIKTPRWKGLTFMSWFAYSRDLASSELGKSDQGNMDPRQFNIWAGPTLLNPNERNVTSWNYALPFGKGKWIQPRRSLNWVVGDWQFSGSAEFSAGPHQGVVLSTDTSGTAQILPMADQLCDNPNSVAGKGRLKWINTACYGIPAFGNYGTSKLGSFVEPGVENVNLALQKDFSVYREDRLQFRADFFNAPNHTQWGYVDNKNGSNTFGQVLAAHPARQIQFSLKLLF